MRLDHVVHIPTFRGHERIGETFAELLDLLPPYRLLIARRRQFTAVHNVYGPLRPHHRHLGRWPRQIDVGTYLLRAHHAVSPAIRLARDHRDLRHRRFRVRVEQLGAVADDAAELLLGARQKTGNVLKRQNREIERIAETDEARLLHGGVNVQASRQKSRLIRHNPNRAAIHSRESHYNIARKMLLDFEELAVVHHAVDDVFDVDWKSTRLN